MSIWLAIDTSGPSLSVALARDERIVFEAVQQNGLTHSDSLMPLVDQALTAGGITPADVELFAVVAGPGSFTGVRIGIATVKGLAQATEKPCVGVNALEALAVGVPLFDGVVCALQDARAGQVYCAAFRHGERLLSDAAVAIETFLETVMSYGRCCFVGDGALRHREAILAALPGAVFAPENAMPIRASNVWLLARSMEPTDWRSLKPYYLRAPQAERERAAREASHG